MPCEECGLECAYEIACPSMNNFSGPEINEICPAEYPTCCQGSCCRWVGYDGGSGEPDSLKWANEVEVKWANEVEAFHNEVRGWNAEEQVDRLKDSNFWRASDESPAWKGPDEKRPNGSDAPVPLWEGSFSPEECLALMRDPGVGDGEPTGEFYSEDDVCWQVWEQSSYWEIVRAYEDGSCDAILVQEPYQYGRVADPLDCFGYA